MTTVPQVQITARNYLLSKGDPPISLNGAIALVAVLYRESRLSPASQGYQPTEHGGILNTHGAYGIASWNGPEDQTKVGDPLHDRQAALLAYATKNGLKVDVLGTQLSFVLTEIANRYANCWAAIRSSASYQSIISILVDEYEVPANKAAEITAALSFAGPLSSLPPPQQPQPAPIPQVPAPQAPIPSTPHPAPPPGLPPISATSAGRRAAEQAYIASMLDQLRAEQSALDEEIAAFMQMAANLWKAEPGANYAAIIFTSSTTASRRIDGFYNHTRKPTNGSYKLEDHHKRRYQCCRWNCDSIPSICPVCASRKFAWDLGPRVLCARRSDQTQRMTASEEILQAIRNFSAIEAERFKITMSTMTDFITKVAQLTEHMKVVSAQQTDIHASLKTAVADLGTAVASGHTTLLDQMMTTLTTFDNGLTAIEAANTMMQTEVKAALATVPITPPSSPA